MKRADNSFPNRARATSIPPSAVCPDPFAAGRGKTSLPKRRRRLIWPLGHTRSQPLAARFGGHFDPVIIQGEKSEVENDAR